MIDEKNYHQAVSLNVADDLAVTLLPDPNHEFLMTSKEVASGYGVTESLLRSHSSANKNDFLEGKHFFKAVQILDTLPQNMQPHLKLWTKRGVVRFGFFIKTHRARMFRDWAEDLIINKLEGTKEPEALSSSENLMKVILNLKDQEERMAVYEAFQVLKREVDIYKETNKVYLLAEKGRILKKLPKNRTIEENRILNRAMVLANSLEG